MSQEAFGVKRGRRTTTTGIRDVGFAPVGTQTLRFRPNPWLASVSPNDVTIVRYSLRTAEDRVATELSKK